MKNFSGGLNSALNPEMKNTSTSTPNKSSQNYTSVSFNQYSTVPTKDEEEIQSMMKSMESLRFRNPDQFATVLINNKKILDMIQKNEITNQNDMNIFENLFQEIEDIDIDYLYWSSHKSIKTVAIEFKNMKLIHFFLIKKGYKLTNKQIYHNFLNDFMISLKHLNFFEETSNDIYLYVSIFQMFINQGDVDVNDNMNEMKNTPLHHAVIFNQFQFLLILLKQKLINLNLLNINGDTPMDMALKNILVKDHIELNEEVCIILSENKGIPNTMKNYFNEVFTTEQNTRKKHITIYQKIIN